MDWKLVAAAILSAIGGAIMALVLGPGLYAVVLFPALVIVIIVAVRKGQRAKAVLLGFLFFLFCGAYTGQSIGAVIRYLLLVLFGMGFLLVFSSFISKEDLKPKPPRSLMIATASFFVIVIAVQVYGWSLSRVAVYLLQNSAFSAYPPELYIYHVVPILACAALVVLILFGNRLVFFVLTPILLVLHVLIVAEFFFGFFQHRVFFEGMTQYINPAYAAVVCRDAGLFAVFICLSLAMTVLFFMKYREGPS